MATSRNNSGESCIICCDTQSIHALGQTLTVDSRLAEPLMGVSKKHQKTKACINASDNELHTWYRHSTFCPRDAVKTRSSPKVVEINNVLTIQLEKKYKQDRGGILFVSPLPKPCTPWILNGACVPPPLNVHKLRFVYEYPVLGEGEVIYL